MNFSYKARSRVKIIPKVIYRLGGGSLSFDRKKFFQGGLRGRFFSAPSNDDPRHWCEILYEWVFVTIICPRVELTWKSYWFFFDDYPNGLQTTREEIAFTARPKIQSQSQIFRSGRSILCLPHQPNFSDIFALCLHWVSIVCDYPQIGNQENSSLE